MQNPPKKFLDQVRDAIRLKHYSYRTEETYSPKDVKTTMIYTHVLNRGGRGVVSPLVGVASLKENR